MNIASWPHAARLRRVAFGVCVAAVAGCAVPQPRPPDAGTASKPATPSAPIGAETTTPSFALGPGDAVTIAVFGRPELGTATYVGDDGAVSVPLVGNVAVAGLSTASAGQRIATAFRQGKYLVQPQVTVTMTQFRGQQVSVLGAVRTPGRFVIESKTTVLDVLALAGGITENGADVVMVLRPGKEGKVTRHAIDLKGLSQPGTPLPTLALRAGDSIFVPAADQFSIYGEVRTPNLYRLEPGMTVVQAISRGGGLTPRGSSSRIEIQRRNPDGTTLTYDGRLTDLVRANDVIRVKERFF